MMSYCRTLTRRGDVHFYGIDLVLCRGMAFQVLVSADAVTDDWAYICQVVKWLNRARLPVESFSVTMEAIRRQRLLFL